MNWKTRIIDDATLSRYRNDADLNTLATRVDALIRHQTTHWPLLREGVLGLPQVITKKISLGPFDTFAQFNPKRIHSTTAKVDTESLQQRSCFLCAKNLPAEEKGVAYGENLMILCNPYPILDCHLSIVHRSHVEQAIAGRFEMMLDLARDLSSDFFVLYNGPRCGASAPHHFHLQACCCRRLPIDEHLRRIESNIELATYKQKIFHDHGIQVLALKNYHLNLLAFRGTNRAALTAWFYRTLEMLSTLAETQLEPLINLIVRSTPPGWLIYLFPRTKHRPACYHAEGENKLTVSPASIDIAGYVVVPMEEDFQKIDSEIVKHIFSEVTLQPEEFRRLIDLLRDERHGPVGAV